MIKSPVKYIWTATIIFTLPGPQHHWHPVLCWAVPLKREDSSKAMSKSDLKKNKLDCHRSIGSSWLITSLDWIWYMILNKCQSDPNSTITLNSLIMGCNNCHILGFGNYIYIYITISDTSIVIPISPMDPAVPSQERLGSIGIGLRNMVLRLVGTCIDSPDVFAIKDSWTKTHRIHVSIYANIWGILMVNVTIYGIHTNPMGNDCPKFTDWHMN